MIPGQNFREKSLKYLKLSFEDVELTYYISYNQNERFFFEKKKEIQEAIQEEVR